MSVIQQTVKEENKKKRKNIVREEQECQTNGLSSVADPDPGSGIGYLFDPWIRDPGWEKVSIRIRDPGSGMNNPDHIF
jgi:hypothetical protein